MLVDDEKDILSTVKRGLESNNTFKVDTFPSGEAALQAFESHPENYYDLVITDIRMPKMNGFELYKQIKTIDNKVKVCFLTAGEMYYGVYSDVFSGKNQFIRKPIENKDLIKRVNEIMGST